MTGLQNRIRTYASEYFFVLGEARKKLGGIGAMMLALAVMDLLGVGLVAPLTRMLVTDDPDSTAAELRQGQFLLLGLALIVVFVVKGVLGYRLNRTIVHFSAGHRATLIGRLIAAYQRQSWQAHVDRNSAEIVNRVLWHTDAYANLTLSASLQLITNGIVCLALFALLAVSDIVAVTVLVAFLGTVFIVTHRIVRPRLKAATALSADYNGRIVRGTKEALDGLREVRLVGAEGVFRDAIVQAARGAATANAQRSALSTVPRYTFEAAVVTILVLIGATVTLLDGSASSAVATLGMFGAAAIRLIPASTALLNSVNHLRSSRFVLGELAGDLAAIPAAPLELDESPAATTVSDPFESLDLVNVSFCYPGRDAPVLRNVDLSIRAGDAVGLMGRSGAGKSTLAELILGLFVPQTGEVRVNGQSIHQNLRAWLNRASYIPQRVFLFDDTLRRNIDFGLPCEHDDSQRMQSSIERAQLAELVASLPEGLDTRIGEGGARLSGGQRQRIALARALYHERDFIILDEATSALDTETENAVVRAVMGLAGTKTILVIAHRESTLLGCTKRFSLHDGRLQSIEGSGPMVRVS